MADKPLRQTENIPALESQVSAIASAGAPFIFFDGAPCYGINDGVIHVTLETLRHQPSSGTVLTDRVITGHLRMSVTATRRLIEALQGALLLGEKVQGPAN